MSASRRFAVLAVLVTSLIAVPLGAPANAAPANYDLVTIATGPQEVPGPGDPNGWAMLALDITPETGRICHVLWYGSIGGPTQVHLHAGFRGEEGAAVLSLRPSWLACRTADPDLLQSIVDNPSGHYANVHNDAYPDGAVRGQLFGDLSG
jgi:hypothetical protein